MPTARCEPVNFGDLLGLTSAVLPGTGGTVTFKYDPFGRRIQKAFTQGTTTTTTNYLYDGANDVEEVDQNGNILARYTQGEGIDESLAELRSGTSAYYEQDGLGSVTSLSGSTGSLTNTYIYKAFGNLANSTGTFVNPYQFTGRDYDPETGLRYYRARYYNSETGRFLSEDPTGFGGGLNFYRYVENDRRIPEILQGSVHQTSRFLRVANLRRKISTMSVMEDRNTFGSVIGSSWTRGCCL